MAISLRVEQPPSLVELVVTKIREAILNGEFALGEKISEEALAAACGVSRTPVRDALFQLQLQGLVYVVPKKGSFVFKPDADDIVAICDYRLMLETHAAALCCKAPKRLVRKNFDSALQAMEHALENNDPVAYHRADTDFHWVLFDHCGNSYVRDGYTLTLGRLTALRTNLADPERDHLQESFGDHHRIADLVIAGDMETLDHIMRRHVGRTQDVYLRALRENKETITRASI